jgi:hypothetical protein
MSWKAGLIIALRDGTWGVELLTTGMPNLRAAYLEAMQRLYSDLEEGLSLWEVPPADEEGPGLLIAPDLTWRRWLSAATAAASVHPTIRGPKSSTPGCGP